MSTATSWPTRGGLTWQLDNIEGLVRGHFPHNAVFSGVNLADLLVRLSAGERLVPVEGRPGVASHMLIQSLLGVAETGGSRRSVVGEVARAASHRGVYAGSREELTPGLHDPPSALALMVVAGQLVASPRSARSLGDRAVNDYALSPSAARTILEISEG